MYNETWPWPCAVVFIPSVGGVVMVLKNNNFSAKAENKYEILRLERKGELQQIIIDICLPCAELIFLILGGVLGRLLVK